MDYIQYPSQRHCFFPLPLAKQNIERSVNTILRLSQANWSGLSAQDSDIELYNERIKCLLGKVLQKGSVLKNIGLVDTIYLSELMDYVGDLLRNRLPGSSDPLPNLSHQETKQAVTQLNKTLKDWVARELGISTEALQLYLGYISLAAWYFSRWDTSCQPHYKKPKFYLDQLYAALSTMISKDCSRKLLSNKLAGHTSKNRRRSLSLLRTSRQKSMVVDGHIPHALLIACEDQRWLKSIGIALNPRIYTALFSKCLHLLYCCGERGTTSNATFRNILLQALEKKLIFLDDKNLVDVINQGIQDFKSYAQVQVQVQQYLGGNNQGGRASFDAKKSQMWGRDFAMQIEFIFNKMDPPNKLIGQQAVISLLLQPLPPRSCNNRSRSSHSHEKVHQLVEELRSLNAPLITPISQQVNTRIPLPLFAKIMGY